MNHPPGAERAVSDLIGAMILISVIVAAFALVGVVMFSQPQSQKVPALNAIISSNAQTIEIHHSGGDSFKASDIQILVDGQPAPFMEDGTTNWETWSVGQTLTYTIPAGESVPSSIQIVYTGGGVSHLIAQSGQGGIAGSINNLPVQPPVVTSITPNSGDVENIISVTDLAGSNFFNGASVKLRRAGSADITASNVVVVSPTRITCEFNLFGRVAGGGAWDVVVTNPGGSTGTLPRGFTMTSAQPPTVDFTGSPLSGTVPLTVSFTDLSTNYPSSWSWIFGDGNTSSAQNPTQTYVNPGNYTVSLTATNFVGSGSLVKTNYITVNPPVTYTINATAILPGGSITPSGLVNVVAGNSQSFTIGTSAGYHVANVLIDSVSNGAISGYTFSNVAANHNITASFAINMFNITASSGPNGNVTPARNTTVSYGGSQVYAITPITGYHVADVFVDSVSNGTVSSYTFTNVQSNHTISATFAINTYTINATAGPNGAISPGNTTVIYGGSQEFTFTPNADYHLSDVLVDNISNGIISNYTFTNVQANHTISAVFTIDPPVAVFSGSPRSGPVPLVITFNDTSTNNPTSWLWNFGDGQISTLRNPTNTYSLAGNYSVSLTVTNAGGSNSTTKDGYIFTYIPAVANFTGTPTSGPASLSTFFTDLSTGSPSSWYWQFGDISIVNTSVSQNPGHTYDSVGIYSVNLTVANSYSSSSLLRPAYINVTTTPPVAHILANKTSGVAPLTVLFRDLSSNTPTSWLWHFDDGTSDVTTKDATHTFANPGSYNVSHTATNAGGSSTAYQIITVSSPPPTFTSITPGTGTRLGGTPVTIVGTNFVPGGSLAVTIGGAAATSVSVTDSTHITAITPPGTVGAATWVNITSGDGQFVNTPGRYTYVEPPTITGISPSSGIRASGTSVTITGTNLVGVTSVAFGSNAATINSNSPTAINMNAPAGTGTVTVTVATPNGTATTSYNYFIIQVFTSSTSWTAPSGIVGIDYLVVAGGGGGGGLGGGGGAGGVQTGTLTTGLTGSKTVTIGTGGAGGTTARASNGANSVFATITATGGGGGGTSSSTSAVATGANGGSGGGGTRNRAGGTGTAGQGNNGGTGGGSTTPYEGGGGGGKSAVGATATNNVGGAGGAGTSYSATFGTGFGVSGVVGGGGGGGVASGTAGGGGTGGGGAGAVGTATITAGIANTGGGGGGSGATSVRGGSGGSGVVVIKYY